MRGEVLRWMPASVVADASLDGSFCYYYHRFRHYFVRRPPTTD
jgi:hypothetical protein